MCFGGGKSAPPPPPPPPPPPAPTPPAPSASTLPDSTAYTEASRKKAKGASQRSALRIDMTGGSSKTVGTGVNTNQ